MTEQEISNQKKHYWLSKEYKTKEIASNTLFSHTYINKTTRY